MSARDHLTILLPLKDRQLYTERWLQYASRELDCRILIADGSYHDTLRDAISGSHAFSRLDLQYIQYPHDQAYSDYYAKLADALAKVKTPFVVMADNDDLFLPDGLNCAVEFLLANPGYVACGGQCAVFWIDAARGEAPADPLYGDRVEWKCSSQFSTDVADTAQQRLRERCLGANDVFYAVHRTELLRSHFTKLRDCNPRDLFLMEQLVMFLTAIAGKTKQLDLLYIARQQDSPGGSGGEHQVKFGDWYDRMLVPTWSEDFTRFVDCATAALSKADGIPADQARSAVIDAYKMSVAPSLLSDLMEEPTVSATMPLTLQLVRRLVGLPRTSLLRRVVQGLYRRTRWVSHDVVHGTEFRTRRARAAAREFSPVRNFLTRRQNSSTSGT